MNEIKNALLHKIHAKPNRNTALRLKDYNVRIANLRNNSQETPNKTRDYA